MKATAKDNPAQDELPLTSVMSHAVFPGRNSLRPAEVAKVLECTTDHIYDLIREGKLKAVDITGASVAAGGANTSDRRFWRIPVTAYDQFVTANQS